MCLSPENYVEARVYQRLVDAGVAPPRARGVAAKVATAYAAKRLVAAEARLAAGASKSTV